MSDIIKTITDSASPFIDLTQPSLYLSAAAILFNPTFWNLAARQEYHNKLITRLFKGNSLYGCYALAITIFALGIARDALYARALDHQPIHPLLLPNTNPAVNFASKFTSFVSSYTSPKLAPNAPTFPNANPVSPIAAQAATYGGYSLIVLGNVLVLSSMYALGITGTYLGDYFGILMDEPVTSFPFNFTGSPMYWGSCCSFVGSAMVWGRPAGLILSALVYGCYKVALSFEDPFTDMIYEKREKEGKGRKTKKNR